VTNLPSHSHVATLRGYNAVGNQTTPSGNSLASAGRLTTYSSNAPDVSMNASSITVGNTGGSQAFSIRDPYLGVYHVIALQGLFPSRS
jgi:microcystin-dependent protein